MARRTGRRAVAITVALAAVACAERGPVDRAQELRDLATQVVAQIDGALEVPGIGAQVEIIRDRWGVPHIYAESVDDLFFAQGLVAAQDRLWQMDWWRRYGAGELAEVLGPEAVAHDRFARLLRYRGDMDAEFGSYHPQGRRILTAFAAGVNAWIDWAEARDALPVEFQITGIRPGRWTAEVPILRMAGLGMTGNNLRELDLARRVAELGAEEANRRAAPDPWHELAVPAGVDYALIPEDFREQMLGGELPKPDLLERYAASQDLFSPVAAFGLAGFPVRAPRGTTASRGGADGSNNWVVNGAMSVTGAPLLANDPHRSIALPSLRYLVHLNAPGWNVIGSGEPALPGVAIGHNERIGWGLTIVGIDQGDMYIERMNPENPNQVWHNGAWEDVETEEIEIAVLGETPRSFTLKYTHHGPVLWEDTENGVAYSFRTVLSEPGTAGYLGSLILDQASDWDSYVEAMKAWKVPSENMIYADVDGNIGWVAAGLAPRREGWVGRLPVPGDGSFEWQGFRDVSELPQEYNPARGYIATANHNIMPANYAPPLGYRWSSPVRFERLREVLGGGGPFSLEDFKALHYDVYSAPAAERIELLRSFEFSDPAAERARQIVSTWDALLNVDSVGAAVYKAWEGAARRQSLDLDSLDAAGAEAAMTAAVTWLETEIGEDWNEWQWGRINRLDRDHALVDTFSLPSVARAGDGTTVNLGYPGHGASFREILDFSDWDASVVTSTPGQSGQPRSPFYRNLGHNWETGEYFPLLYTREAVMGHAAHRLLLLPTEGS